MTPDELTCTTCEDEWAVVAQAGYLFPLTEEEEEAARHFFAYHGRWFWRVDTCPECGRGREVGKL